MLLASVTLCFLAKMDVCTVEKLSKIHSRFLWVMEVMNFERGYCFLQERKHRTFGIPLVENLDYCQERIVRISFKAALLDKELEAFLTFMTPQLADQLTLDSLAKDMEDMDFDLDDDDVDEVEGRQPLRINDVISMIFQGAHEIKANNPVLHRHGFTIQDLNQENCYQAICKADKRLGELLKLTKKLALLIETLTQLIKFIGVSESESKSNGGKQQQQETWPALKVTAHHETQAHCSMT